MSLVILVFTLFILVSCAIRIGAATMSPRGNTFSILFDVGTSAFCLYLIVGMVK